MSKYISKVKTILFDGTEARFSLSVEGHFTKAKPDGSTSNLVYVSDNGTVNINPSIYLVFAYKGDTFEESKAVFTSFPQLYKLRSSMNLMRQYLETPECFSNVDGAEIVNPNYSEPLYVMNIGQAQNWISFALTVIGNADGTIGHGVTIKYSGTEFASVLTEDEFFTISEIINEINLENYKLQMSSLVILNNNASTPVASNYSMYNNNFRSNNNVSQPQMVRNNTVPVQNTPRYQSTGRQPMPQQNTRVSVNNNFNPNNEVPQQNNVRQTAAPSRETIVNMNSVEAEAPMFQMSFADEEEIAKIFGTSEE